MKLKNLLPAALLVAASVPFSAAPVAAAPVFCADPSDDLELSDVTFRDNNADDCYGIIDSPAIDSVGGVPADWAVNTLGLFGGEWEDYVKTGDEETGYQNLHWELSTDDPATGDWKLTVSDPTAPPSHYPQTIDLLVVLKSGGASSGGWIAYLFEAETFLTDGENLGEYLVKIFNDNGQPRDLSHMSVYLRDGGDNVTVAEPATLSMLGIGLIGAFARRRRTV